MKDYLTDQITGRKNQKLYLQQKLLVIIIIIIKNGFTKEIIGQIITTIETLNSRLFS